LVRRSDLKERASHTTTNSHKSQRQQKYQKWQYQSCRHLFKNSLGKR
jgi:hypothetical protein